MVTLDERFEEKISDDDDKGYGSDESLAKAIPVENTAIPQKSFQTIPHSTQLEDKGITSSLSEIDKPAIESQPIDSVPAVEPIMSRRRTKKVRNKFRIRKSVWRDFFAADCFRFRIVSTSRSRGVGNDDDDEVKGVKDDTPKDSNEGCESQLESKKPSFGVDYEKIELGSKLNHKLRPASSGKLPKIRLHLKSKLSIWEMGKTFRKHLQACLKSAEKRKKKGKTDAEVQYGSENKVVENNFDSNASSNLINFVVDAQTISGELPVDLASMLIDLQSRDLTPEDYEMLLMLDDSLERKCLPRSIVDLLPVSLVSLKDGCPLTDSSSDRNCPKDENVDANNKVDVKNCDTDNQKEKPSDNQTDSPSSNDVSTEIDQAEFPSSTITTITITTTTTRAKAVITDSKDQECSSCMLESTYTEEYIESLRNKCSISDEQNKNDSKACQSTASRPDKAHPIELPLPDLIPRETNNQKDSLPILHKQTLDIVCSICQEHFEIGQEKVTLPCSHFFHLECGIKWLTESSKNCPLDGLEVCVDR